MAHYPKLKSTSKGRELIAKASATGKGIEFTKVITGDGNLTNENIDTMNAIISPKLEIPVTPPGQFIGDGQFQIEFAMSNASVNNGFYAREIGVYAKLVGESDSSAKLVAYTNGGNFVDYIPNKETPINSKVFQVDVAVGDAEVVTVKRIDAAYLTQGAMDAHNASKTAHSAAFGEHNKSTSAHKPILNAIKELKGTPAFDTVLPNNKTILDLINLVGLGGIVAAKLDANAGFIKFANGFIIQWGRVEYNSLPNYQIIVPSIRMRVLCAVANDIGYMPNTGGTFVQIDVKDVYNIAFRPIYGGNDNSARWNGTIHSWIALGVAV